MAGRSKCACFNQKIVIKSELACYLSALLINKLIGGTEIINHLLFMFKKG